MNQKKKGKKSALQVQRGVDQPPGLNPEAQKRIRQHRKKKYSPQQYVEGILRGDRSMLSQAITLVESSLPEHNRIAREVIEACLPHAGSSVRIGITGIPGVGKSTFIESFGKLITGLGRKLAVLAIDPSSERSHGSIMGDKTRMEELSTRPDVFIRPSPTAGSLGGVARKTRESIILCEAAGYNTVFVETVGVGQSETAVHSMVDFFLLLMLAGAGDELQGIKRGIMEMADTIVITKADGENLRAARQARAEYHQALHLFPPADSGWTPKVLTCSALKNEGLKEIWDNITGYLELTTGNGYYRHRRRKQAGYWMHETIRERLRESFATHPEVRKMLPAFEEEVLQGKISSFTAARELLEAYFKK